MSGDTRIYAAIDPGPVQSGWVVFNPPDSFDAFGIHPNEEIPQRVQDGISGRPAVIGIEKICCYGLAVGAETYRTVWWSGIFHVRLGCIAPVYYIPRRDTSSCLTGRPNAKDAQIRAALIERFGQPSRSRKTPGGILYGITGDAWLAAGLAVYMADLDRTGAIMGGGKCGVDWLELKY